MPVLSPHRSSASGLSGSYRSTFSSSALDRPPYYSSSSYSPRITSYSERYSSRSYADSDGRRVYARSGSITEDGITTRFREESREGSAKRELGSYRDNSISDYSSRRDSSLSRNDRLSSLNVVDSVAELRQKYSPSNYIPSVLRKNENISRSKSINDIGLPPIESKTNKKKVNEALNFNNSVLNSNNTNNDNMTIEDDNGNRASVADLRKKFDDKSCKPPKNSPLQIEGSTVKIAENNFKKNDAEIINSTVHKNLNGKLKNSTSKKNLKINGESSSSSTPSPSQVTASPSTSSNLNNSKENSPDLNTNLNLTKNDNNLTKLVINGSSSTLSTITQQDVDDNNAPLKDSSPPPPTNSKLELDDNKKDEKNGYEIKGGSLSADSELNVRSSTRVNNFASYIPAKDFKKTDNEEIQIVNGTSKENETTDYLDTKSNDLTASPKLNRSSITPSNSSSLSNRRSSDRESSSRRIDYGDDDSDRNYTNIRSSTTKTLGLNGLKNIGNTCFMNSVIQCLSNTKQLLEYVRRDGYTRDINTTISSMKGALIKAFAEVLKELWSDELSDRVVNTVSLKSQIQRFAPRFMGYAQQDAQEFLRYLLEGLHEDVNRVTEKPKPIITEIDEKLSDAEKAAESWSRYLRMDNSKIVDVFVGQLKSTLKCTYCGHCSVTFDPFWDLSLPIPQRTGQLRLSQCLESFTREETLDGDEKPTCSKCKERRKCTKSFSIQKFPKILVIHLKRFSPTERFRGKLNVTVDFPLEGLDMSNYAADSIAPCRYNLYAISNHSGTTYSGHYTAYCRHPYTQTWHEYNDSRVSSISSRSIVSSEAYVLFYEQEGQRSSHL